MTRLKDWDAVFAEQAKEPLQIHVLGRDWELPAEASAAQVLRLQGVRSASFEVAARLKGDPGAAITEPDLQKVLGGFDFETEARELLGADTFEAWVSEGLPYRTLIKIFWWAVGVYEGSESATFVPPEHEEAVSP